MSHFYAMETAIAEKLSEAFKNHQPRPRVYRSRDLANIKDKSQGDLSIFVAYNGIVAVSEAAPNVYQLGSITHEYMIWVVSKSAKDHGTQAGTRELADPILERVIELLMGQRPIKDEQVLRLAPSGLSPAYSTNGYGYFPLAFHHHKKVGGKA